MNSTLISTVTNLNVILFDTGPPDQVRNCSITNYTSDSLRIECEEGYDGGLQQKFYLEVYNEAQEYLEKNLTRIEPVFYVADIPASTEYILVIYAANMKGRSSSVVIKGSTDAAPRSEQGVTYIVLLYVVMNAYPEMFKSTLRTLNMCVFNSKI